MFRSRTALLTALVLAFASQVAAAGDLCLHGCPVGAPMTNKLIARSIYILSNNGQTKFADWVAYRVTRDSIAKSEARNWKKDPDLPDDETLSPADYERAREVLKVDRGHQAPLASLSGARDWRLANYLSNITPQAAALNEGPWKNLEAAERDLVRSAGVAAVYSVTGPLYEKSMPSLPETEKSHRVPSGYWKVIAIETNGDLRVAAFVMSQTAPRKADYCSSADTVRDVELRTHLNFFPELPKPRQDEIETTPGGLLKALGCP